MKKNPRNRFHDCQVAELIMGWRKMNQEQADAGFGGIIDTDWMCPPPDFKVVEKVSNFASSEEYISDILKALDCHVFFKFNPSGDRGDDKAFTVSIQNQIDGPIIYAESDLSMIDALCEAGLKLKIES
jgi:hypothetical protein